jgi:hypothetical protein
LWNIAVPLWHSDADSGRGYHPITLGHQRSLIFARRCSGRSWPRTDLRPLG